jgi:malate dehydrogenase (oxaloacetate-decarboxylating)(NADP+)
MHDRLSTCRPGGILIYQTLCIYSSQANNAYIFPAVGHAASIGRWPAIAEDVFLFAAEALAGMQPVEEIRLGR